jgi:capsular exopolysaccharide synthesis family protein
MDNQLQPRGLTPEPPSPFITHPDFAMGYGSDGSDSVHLSEYWYILRKRQWWVIGFFLGVVLLVGAYTFTRTPIYRATAELQIIQDNPNAFIGEQRLDPFAGLQFDQANKFYETQYKLLTSRPMAYKLLDSLKLSEHPEFKIPLEEAKKSTPEKIRSAMAQQIMASLDVQPVKNTYLVEVSYLSADRELAQNIVNAVHREYLQFSMETRQQSFAMIRLWLERELSTLAGRVETSQRRIYDHGRANDYLALEGEDNVVVKKFVELNRLLTTAQAERMAKESQLQQIRQKGPEAPLILNNPLVLRLREDMIGQEAKVSGTKKLFGKNYPKLQAENANLAELRTRLNAELKRIQDGVKADYEVALRAEKFIREEFDRQKGKVEKLQDNLVQHQILKRDLQTNEQLYQGLLARMKEANVASTMMPSNVAVIESAELPETPFRPRKGRNMALAIMVGLFGGIGLAFLVEYLDNSIKTTEELERVVRLPALGVLPMLTTNGKRALNPGQSVGLSAYEKPKSPMGDAISHVSAALMLSLSGRPPAAIMVTSPNVGDGKTSISVNLASSLAMTGRRVVLVDTDMRRPLDHKIFGLALQPGLSNFITGSVSLEEIIQPTQVPGLSLIAAGTVPPNPVQLLSSQVFVELMQQLRQEFQHLILDTPPIIGFPDGRIISSLTDGVLLVFKHHVTSRESGRLAAHLLEQVNANIFGVVLNMAQAGKFRYGDYYGYQDYYNKYYKEYHDE